MNFVKLTTFRDLLEVFVNMDNVTEVRPHKDGGAVVFFCNSFGDDVDHSRVTETPIQIMDKVYP